MVINKLEDCILSSDIISQINVNNNNRIQTNELALVDQFLSVDYLDVTNFNNYNIIYKINDILSQFKSEPPPPKGYTLTIKQVANDGKTPITGACEFSEILPIYVSNTKATVTIIPNTIYDDVKYKFLRWSDGSTELTRTFTMSSDISLDVVFDVTPVKTNFLIDLYKQINILNNSDDTNNKVYYQTEDIDLTDINLTANPELNLTSYNGSTVWPGIGTSKTNAFKGIYIGNNHTIKVKCTAQKQNAPGAIFAYTDGATFKDINVFVDGADDKSQMIKYGAGLVGECCGSTRSDNFINITVNGTIGSSDHHVQYGAGICGKANSRTHTTNFTNCINNADIFATGLNGAISGQKIGGICAYASGTDIASLPGAKFENCENHGNITTNADYVNLLTQNEGIGGLLGNSGQEGISQWTYINNCMSTGRISFADASGTSNIKEPTFSVGQLIGTPRLLKFMGNIYIKPDFKACKQTSSIGTEGQVPFVIGYYDETDNICTKNNLIKLIPASQIKNGKQYHTVFANSIIQIPSNITSIELDTTAADNTVKDSNNNVLTGVVIDPAKPNIKRYTVA